MTNPIHHKNIRKRIYVKKQPYPHPNRGIKWFDRFIVVAGIFIVIATIPQVLEIWVNQSAEGVSTMTWCYYVFYSISFMIYGIIHKEFPIIFNYAIGSVVYILVVIGSLIY